MSHRITRRSFCKIAAAGICLPGAGSAYSLSLLAAPSSAKAASTPDTQHLKEVLFYEKLPDKTIECGICPRKCRIADLERGYCGNKENRGGSYYSLVYGRPCARHVDPIEKKPLFHYLPGSSAFSLAAAGCNFECRFCQNWRIAQYRPEQIESLAATPETIVAQCLDLKAATIAYTYTEPVVFYGYMNDCAREGRRKGIGSVMISNGYINEKPLRALCAYLTAVKIDLKAFSDSFYQQQCSGRLQPVLDTLQILKDIGIWFEIVVLIIPTLNDGTNEIQAMCSWIQKHLGPDVPLHFTRFHPMYKIRNLPPTPIKTLERCYKIARDAGLNFPYIGNVPGHAAESTICPGCGSVAIRRIGYSIRVNMLPNGVCAVCTRPIPGVWCSPPAI